MNWLETFGSTLALPWSRGELWHCGNTRPVLYGHGVRGQLTRPRRRFLGVVERCLPLPCLPVSDKQTTPLKCGQVWSIWPARSER